NPATWVLNASHQRQVCFGVVDMAQVRVFPRIFQLGTRLRHLSCDLWVSGFKFEDKLLGCAIFDKQPSATGFAIQDREESGRDMMAARHDLSRACKASLCNLLKDHLQHHAKRGPS